MYLIDTHCHLDMLDYNKKHKNYQDVLDKAKLQNVKEVIQVSCYLEKYQQYRADLEKFDNVHFSVGIHPLYVNDVKVFDEKLFRELVIDSRVCAIGECGLDGYYSKENLNEQKFFFEKQINLANEFNKPLIIHSRSEAELTYEILKTNLDDRTKGVLHCFTESLEFAKKLLDLGFYIGVGGVITFKSAHQLRDIMKYVPLDRMLLETDSPYLSPMPYRGKENEPAYVSNIAKFLVDIKNVSFPTIIETTTNNAKKLFKI